MGEEESGKRRRDLGEDSTSTHDSAASILGRDGPSSHLFPFKIPKRLGGKLKSTHYSFKLDLVPQYAGDQLTEITRTLASMTYLQLKMFKNQARRDAKWGLVIPAFVTENAPDIVERYCEAWAKQFLQAFESDRKKLDEYSAALAQMIGHLETSSKDLSAERIAFLSDTVKDCRRSNEAMLALKQKEFQNFLVTSAAEKRRALLETKTKAELEKQPGQPKNGKNTRVVVRGGGPPQYRGRGKGYQGRAAGPPPSYLSTSQRKWNPPPPVFRGRGGHSFRGREGQ